VKLFGESTAGAFGNLVPVSVGHSGFGSTMQEVNFFQASNPSYYITHTMFPVDSAMWLNKDSVCNGRDNVSYDAIRWIESDYVAVKNVASTPSVRIFPNPASHFINLSVNSASYNTLNIRLYNMLGSVINEYQYNLNAGDNTFKLSIDNNTVPPGNYYLAITDMNGTRIIKKISIIH
jgi:hypothetical protein